MGVWSSDSAIDVAYLQDIRDTQIPKGLNENVGYGSRFGHFQFGSRVKLHEAK